MRLFTNRPTIRMDQSSSGDTDNLPLDVLGMFRIIFKSAGKHFEKIEKSVGISGAQLWALSEIAEAPGGTVSDLSRTMRLHQSTTSNLIEKLESKGLVNRIRSAQDRRVVQVTITPDGIAILEQAPGPNRGILPDALMRMPPEDLAQLKTTLNKLLEVLDQKSDSAAGEPLGTPIKLTD